MPPEASSSAIADTMARRFASTTSLDTTLYRQLLRLGRALDRSAIARAMLVAAPEQLFDRQTQAVISLPQLDGVSAEAFIFWAPPRMACADAKRGTRRV